MEERKGLPLVVIKGGGDIGSAVAHALFQDGFPVLIVEEPQPKAVRRGMAYASAVTEGTFLLEGIRGVLVRGIAEARALLRRHAAIPVLTDPVETIRSALRPAIVVDARMWKRATPDTRIDEAPFVIGLGPGFRAKANCHVAIETNRGPRMGAIIEEGETEAYTGIPMEIEGTRRERYTYAPCGGVFRTSLEIGMMVEPGQVVGAVGEVGLRGQVRGIVRGVLPDGTTVRTGQKLVDIDPRGKREFITGIADRPRAIAEGVRTAIRRRLSSA